MIRDSYKTIKASTVGIFKDRSSKFIGLSFRVSSSEEVKEVLERVKKEYRDARHHCYAYRIGTGDDNWRVNDDGEPSGTAGKPIMGQINSFELTNVLIVVVRYFGGTLLGVGGLINAYRSATKEALLKAEIITELIMVSFDLTFPYSSMNDVMTLIKEANLYQANQVFELECSIRISLRQSKQDAILKKLDMIKDLSYKRLI